MLIRNVLALGFLIIVYYMSILIVGWLWDTIDTDISVMGNIADAMPEEAMFLWNFIIYFMFPLIFAIAFIVKTKPRTQYGYSGGFG